MAPAAHSVMSIYGYGNGSPGSRFGYGTYTGNDYGSPGTLLALKFVAPTARAVATALARTMVVLARMWLRQHHRYGTRSSNKISDFGNSTGYGEGRSGNTFG